MRKLFLCLLMAFTAVTVSLKAQTIVFNDGFESGNLSKWTQENVVGQGMWAVESIDDNLLYPATVLQGKHRAFLRNTSGETQGYVTRLVTPVMDLTEVYQPMVVFWYANPKWTADRDTLRLLYKTGPKANWKQLAEYSDAKANWTKVAISLPEYNSETYQIAFEGKDNLGRGIVLDSVVVRSAPECTVPRDIQVTSEGAGKATISWAASWDATEFDFLITTEAIDPDTLANIPDSIAQEVIKYNTKVDGMQHSKYVELTSGEYFYVYIRSVCEAEISDWNAPFRFRMSATKFMPYEYNFNMNYNGGYISRDPEWTWGNNVGVYTPHINTTLNSVELAKYSIDATTCLAFNGLYSVTSTATTPNPIPAGKYAYAATPALADSTVADFNLKDYQVRFWATVHKYTGAYAHSIIVGVMTDPEDYTTFVAVDTVSVWGYAEFEEKIVSLANYQGEGAYVAFASDFDKQNLFYVDKMTIERRPAVNKVTKISVNPRDTFAVISWEGNAPSYNIIIADVEKDDPETIFKDNIVDQATVTTNSYICDKLEAFHSWNRPYYVYVQAVDGAEKLDWSYRYAFVTTASPEELPMSFNMEQDGGSYYLNGDASRFFPGRVNIFSNNADKPYLYTTNPHAGSLSDLYMSKDCGNDTWVTFPPIENLKEQQMSFYLSGNTTFQQTRAIVGVMANPMDINTLTPVAEFTLTKQGYARCYVNFSGYTGNDSIVAIVWADLESGKNTNNYIDDVVFEAIGKCLPVVNLQTEATTDSVTISWDKSTATQWEFVFAKKAIEETELANFADLKDNKDVIVADTLQWSEEGKPTFGVGGLDWNTPYYIYVCTLCGDERAWWAEAMIKTACPESFPFPFKEDFESYEVSGTEAGCWTLINYIGTGYPKILAPTSGAQSGNQLELWSASTTHRTVAVMPKVEGDLSNMLLQLDARSYGPTTKTVLYIGQMADIRDTTTFVALDTFYLPDGNNFTKIRMDLSQYNLVYDNIVFSSGLGSTLEMNSDIYIDNVELKTNTCIEAWDFKPTDIQPTSIDVAWSGKSTEDKWEVKVLSKYAALKDNKIAPYDTAKVAVVNDTIITGKNFHVEGLNVLTQYYFYVRTLCGDSIWMVDSVKSGCTKLNPNVPNKETFESYPSGTSYNAAQQADCWTVGNGNPSATTTYIPYIYKTTSYAASGTNAYRLYPTSTYSPTWVATPEIDVEDMSDLAVTFSFYGSATYYILPGVMTDPTDLSTFVVLDSIKCQAKIVTLTMDLSEYKDTIPASAKYFAWRTAYNAGPTIYLDDVSIVKMKCPMAKPSLSELTSSGVRISSGLGADSDYDWALLVTNSPINVDLLDPETNPIPESIIVYNDTISTPSKLLKDTLKEKTNYYVYVATVCDEGFPMWKTLEFTTPCEALTPEAMGTITFSEAEGYVSGTSATRYLPCWTVGNKSGNASATSTYIPYVNTTTTYMHNGNKFLNMYSYVPTSATSTPYDGAYAIMPQLAVDDITKYQVNFWARTTTSTGANYNDNLIIGVVTDPTDLNTFVAVDTITLSHTAHQPFTVSMEEYKGDYQGNKGKYVMFLVENGTRTYGYAYITEISVSAIPTCRPVKEFKVDSIAEDLAVVSLTGYTEKYRLLLSDKALKDDEKPTYAYLLDSVVTHADGIVIDGLTAATHYYLYAQGICSETDSTDISMAYADIFTECPVVKGYPAPYYTDFDHNAGGTGSGKKPDCWSGVYMVMDTVSTSQTYPYIYTTASYAASTPNSMYMYSYGYWNNTDKKYTSNTKTYAVAPMITGNLADYMVSFYARKGGTTVAYGNLLRVGYVTDATERGIDTTFVKIADVDVTTATQQPYQVIIGDYVSSIPAGARLALLADWGIQTYAAPTANTSYYGTMYIDNFKIGMPPSCFPPALEPGNTSLHTADVAIIPAKAENTAWQIAVVPDSVYSKEGYDAAKYLAGSEVRIVDADSPNFTISGLDHSSKYWLYGRTVCGGEDGNSAWTDVAVPTRTQYYFKDGYYFGFEKTEGWEFCQGSTSTTYWLNPAINVGYSGGSATTSYTSYYPYQMANTTSAIYAYGPREAADPKNAALRWYATSSYWGGYAIFPGVDEAHDRSFEFKVRCGYGSYNSTKDTIGISTNYECNIEVGTIDKNKGYDTYQVVATVNLPVIPKTKGGLTEANDWFWTQVTMDLDSATVADKQMVLRLPKPIDSNSRYIHFDDVTLGAPKGFGLVAFNKIKTEPQKATITWENIGGPWNLYILEANGDTLAKYENLSDVTLQEVTGLQPQTTYTAVLKAAIAPSDTKFKTSDSREFRTPCLPIELDANNVISWDFNDRSGWERSDVLVGGANANTTDTCYWKPECFTVGTTYASTQTTSTVYYNWLIQRKGYSYTSAPTGNPTTSATSTARYEYGRGDSPALRVYTSSTYMTPYLVLPELNCRFDTMMIEFWGRCFCNYASDYGTAASQNKMVSASYCGGNYSQKMVVGTLTDPKDFSTLQVIDTVTYDAYTSTTADFVTKDPTGNRYWQKFQVPLSAATGKYIVLFQPAYGLFFLDDLSVKPIGDNIFTPGNPTTSNVTTTTAELNWTVKHPTFPSVVVVTNQDGTAEVLRDTTYNTYYIVDGLQPGTGYQWYVYQTNLSFTANSSETPRIDFNTECLAINPHYTCGFEMDEGWKLIPGQTNATYKQTQCWVYGNAGTATSWSSTYDAYNRPSSGTVSYNHTKDGGAFGIWMYAYSTTYQPYIAMPAMDLAALDTLQVNFWMRPGYHNPGTGKISYQCTVGSTASSAEYYYSKSIIVGTMTDPNDATTFVPIDTVTYEGTLSTADDVNEANDYLFQLKKVSLAGATGQYVAFMTTLYAKGETRKSTYGYMGLDDIYFSPIQTCTDPTNLSVSQIGTDSAVLSWEAGELSKQYILEVATDPSYDSDKIVYTDTVDTKTDTIRNLAPYTQYVWHVKSICGADGESDFSANGVFTTLRVPFYLEDFRNTTLDEDWQFGTNPASEILDAAEPVEFNGTNNTTYGWKRLTTSVGIAGAHYVIPFYTSSSTTTTYRNYWMVSPTVVLPEDKAAHLSANVAFTQCATSTPAAGAPAAGVVADDWAVMVVISADGGKTWLTKDVKAFVQGQALYQIPATSTTLRVDLSEYAGKPIKVGFYRYAQTYKSTANAALHLGSVRINYFDEMKIDTTLCQYEDLEAYEFVVDGDKISAGDHTWTRTDWAGESEAKAGALDTIYTLNAHYNAVPETIIEDTICEGDTYTNYNFSGPSRTGVYKQKLQGVNSCDSVVCLHLYVRPREYTNLDMSICQGQALEFTDKFIGQKLDRTGVYIDTIVSSHGCDSVITLNLTVVDAFRSEFSVAVCPGTGYYWEAAGKSYSEPGDYTDTLQTATGCDSIVTLHLSNKKVYNEKTAVTICEGGSYEFGDKVLTQPGEYTYTFESALGCDSTVTLTLSISDMYRDSVKVEIIEGQSYEFYGVVYTEADTVEVMRPGMDGDCDSLRVLVITVIPDPEAIENVEMSKLVLRPSLLTVGQTVRADYNFTAADLASLKVEVYDIIGRKVEARTYNEKPVIIDAFHAAGVYTIRITSGTGLNLVGRVIVR